jgi:succinate-acetate transporter protein
VSASVPVIGNPGALGLAAFGMTTFLLSMVSANLVNKGVAPMVLGVALMVGGVGQVLAGMWEFRVGNTFGGTAFVMYGGFWLSFWALNQFYVKDIPVLQAGNAVGLYLIAWAMFTGLMFIASFKTNRAINVIFGLLLITFVLLGIGNAGAHTTMIHWGGYFGLLTAAAAGYTACAVVTNETFGRTILPVKPL